MTDINLPDMVCKINKKEACSINDPGCVYHACMTSDCQKKEVINQGVYWGPGNCNQGGQVLTTLDLQEIDEAHSGKSTKNSKNE